MLALLAGLQEIAGLQGVRREKGLSPLFLRI